MKQFDQERFRETFDCIQAPSGTVQEVFTMAHAHHKTRIRPILCAALIALLALSATAAAASLFSSLDADKLTLNGIYQGDGIITVEVENRSGKQLDFQPCLKLMEWYSGQEVPAAGDIRFTDTSFGPHSSGIMTVDLSAAYDISALEQPSEARYYLVLTNNWFSFGQDWHCGISFCDPLPTGSSDLPAASAPAIVQVIPAEFQDYFSTIDLSPVVRRSMNDAYAARVLKLLDSFGGTVVPAACPFLLPEDPPANIVFDSGYTAGPQVQLTGLQETSFSWSFKQLAAPGEHLRVLSAMLPLTTYSDAWRDIPICYYAYYEKSAVSPDAYAFLYGQLIPFSQLESYLIWEDDTHLCYEVHHLIYSDLRAYVENWLEWNPEVSMDDTLWNRVQAIYQYYTHPSGFIDPS